MFCTLYIDPSSKIGSSFSQGERATCEDEAFNATLSGGFLIPEEGLSGRKNDLSSSQAPEYPLHAGLLCENDKSTGKAVRNLDKIPRLARVPLLASLAARVFLKLI